MNVGVITDAQIELGRYSESVETLQSMVDLHPDMSSYSRVSYLRELHGDISGAIDMMQRAVDYWDRVRRFYFRDVLIHRTRLAQAEHRAMLVQMQTHDITALEQTVRDHNRGALAAYMSHLEGSSDHEKRERPA